MPAARRLALLPAVALAACSDPSGPGGGHDSGSIRLAALPPNTVITERGVTFGARHLKVGPDVTTFDQVPLTSAAVVVDPGTPGETVRPVSRAAFIGTDGQPATFWADVPGDGRHTIALRVTDASGKTEEAWFTRDFRVPELPYQVTELPGLGGDSTMAIGLDERGGLAGWARTAAGRRRAVVWRGGAPTVLPAPDTVDAIAVRLDGAGDVLGELRGPAGGSVQLWRADGATFPLAATFPAPPGFPGTYRCCDVAADLSEARVAMAHTDHGGAVLLDAVSGETRTFPRQGWFFGMASLNSAGRALGWVRLGDLYGTAVMSLEQPSGFAIATPEEEGERYCGQVCTGGRAVSDARPVAIDDDGDVLWWNSGRLVHTAADGHARFLDRYLGVGTSQAAMSRRGGIAVGLDRGDSSLYLWQRDGSRTGRVRLDGWRIDALGSVNAQGAIAAHGVHVVSGRRAALLLIPSTAP